MLWLKLLEELLELVDPAPVARLAWQHSSSEPQADLAAEQVDWQQWTQLSSLQECLRRQHCWAWKPAAAVEQQGHQLLAVAAAWLNTRHAAHPAPRWSEGDCSCLLVRVDDGCFSVRKQGALTCSLECAKHRSSSREPP